jgi:hypothetical protein
MMAVDEEVRSWKELELTYFKASLCFHLEIVRKFKPSFEKII